MTICVSIQVSEGLVLAADSASAVEGGARGPNGELARGILKTYENARKLSHLKDYPIGTLSWGTALVGSRSVASLIKEYEYSLPSLAEEEQQIRDRRLRGEANGDQQPQYRVKAMAEGLLDHIQRHYDTEYANQPLENRPILGMLVSGYSAGEFFAEQWLVEIPLRKEVAEIRSMKNGKPDLGANWFGLTDAITRLHWGRDDGVIRLVAQRFGVAEKEVHELLAPLQYAVAFDGMPLQDAIDYAAYLVNAAIGRFRFVIGPPLCGGAVDIAVITPNAFTWVQRKTWK